MGDIRSGGKHVVHWRLSAHAREEIVRRGLGLTAVERTIGEPHQIVEERGGLKAYQSLTHRHDGREYLLRVIVDDSIDPLVVVTAYQTSKVQKYWRADEDLV